MPEFFKLVTFTFKPPEKTPYHPKSSNTENMHCYITCMFYFSPAGRREQFLRTFELLI